MKFPTGLAIALATIFGLATPAFGQVYTDPPPRVVGPVRPPPPRQPCDPGVSLRVERMVRFNFDNPVHTDLMRRAARQNNASLARGRTPRDIMLDLIAVYYPAHPEGIQVPRRYGYEIIPYDRMGIWVEERGNVPSEQVCHHDDNGNNVPYPGLVPSALLTERSIVFAFAEWSYRSRLDRPTARFVEERDSRPRGILLAMNDVAEVGRAIRAELQRQAAIAAGIEDRRRAETARSAER